MCSNLPKFAGTPAVRAPLPSVARRPAQGTTQLAGGGGGEGSLELSNVDHAASAMIHQLSRIAMPGATAQTRMHESVERPVELVDWNGMFVVAD